MVVNIINNNHTYFITKHTSAHGKQNLYLSARVFIFCASAICIEIKRIILKWVLLWTYAIKYFSHCNLFKALHTICFMPGLSIYEIKRICLYVKFYIIAYGSFQHLTNFSKQCKKTSPKYQSKIVVILSKILSFNYNSCL